MPPYFSAGQTLKKTLNEFWGEPFDVAVRGLGGPGGTQPSAAFGADTVSGCGASVLLRCHCWEEASVKS